MIGDNGNRRDRRQMLVATLLTPCNEATFQQCLEQLDDYIAAQLAGEDYVALYPQTAVLLDACPDCAAAYARLYEMETAVRSQTLPQPTHIPQPDLSFLPQAASLLAQLRQAFQQRLDGSSLQLTQGLVALLTPPPVLTRTRAPADSGRYHARLLRLGGQAETAVLNLPFTLEAYRDGENETLCLVQVTLLPGDELDELFEKTVVLGWENGGETAVTDWGGLAEFVDIPVTALPQLHIQVNFEDS